MVYRIHKLKYLEIYWSFGLNLYIYVFGPKTIWFICIYKWGRG